MSTSLLQVDEDPARTVLAHGPRASVISICVLALGASPALVLRVALRPAMMAASPATVEAGGGVQLDDVRPLALCGRYDGQRDLFSGIIDS